jgi:hypothetical protein
VQTLSQATRHLEPWQLSSPVQKKARRCRSMALITVLGTFIANLEWRGRELRTEVAKVSRPARFRRVARQLAKYLSQEEMMGRQSAIVGEWWIGRWWLDGTRHYL